MFKSQRQRLSLGHRRKCAHYFRILYFFYRRLLYFSVISVSSFLLKPYSHRTHRTLAVCSPYAHLVVHRSDYLNFLNDCSACSYRSLSTRWINVCGTVSVFEESVILKLNRSCDSNVFIVFWCSQSFQKSPLLIASRTHASSTVHP